MYGLELYQNRKNIAKLNICDNSIFFLIQNEYKNSREIAKLLNLFSYDLLAESITKLHNLQLVKVNLANGEIQLTEQVLSVIDQLNVIAQNNKYLDNESLFKVLQEQLENKEFMRYFKGCIIL